LPGVTTDAVPLLNATPKAQTLEPKVLGPVVAPERVQKISSDPVKEARPQSLATDAADFVRQLWPHAQQAARELGVDAKTLIAHAALETGWGRFVPCNPDGSCSFNLFGIKASGRWQGAATVVNTLEYEGGVAVKKRESFRAYDSPADSFRDYAAFIKNSPRYQSALGTGADAATFASALQNGGYATDPNYAAKLASVASRLNAMTPQIPLKVADSRPLTTGRSVSAGEGT
jgi:flagellar rod assembly protein/muramidase FlgJ